MTLFADNIVTYQPAKPTPSILVRSGDAAMHWWWACRHCRLGRSGFQSQPHALAAGWSHLVEDHS